MHVELGRHPLASILDTTGIDHVLDVGANRGGFGQRVRLLGHDRKITSFEPVSSAFAELKAVSARDPRWTVVRGALGINVAEADNLSSIRPATPWMLKNYRETSTRSTEEVRVDRLDEVYSTYVADDENVLLKIDTQGFEREVLDGASGCLDSIRGLQLELSFSRQLYSDEALSVEIIQMLHSLGYSLVALQPLYYNVEWGELLQGDGVFVRL